MRCRVPQLAVSILLLSFTLPRPAGSTGTLLASVDEVLEEVVQIRQLELKRPIKKGIKNRQEIRGFLMGRIEKEYSPEQVALEERILTRLGLIPEELDLYQFTLDLLTEQVAGYYDPYTETFYVADWIPLEIQKPVMAHELTHALQDQHFGLERFLRRIEGNDDAALARSALIEGEGLAVMLEYSLKPLGQSFLDIPDLVQVNRAQVELLNHQFEVFARSPEYLKETLLFPYTYGARFVQAFRRQHSWDRLALVYDDLPQSTEQILHPEKYLGPRDLPVVLAEGQFSGSGGSSWKPVYHNVLGEFSTYLWLRQFLDERTARTASEGWGGDRLELYRNGQGLEALVLRFVWDSEADAQEFYEACRQLVEVRFPRARKAAENVWEQEGERLSLTQEGLEVGFTQESLSQTAPGAP